MLYTVRINKTGRHIDWCDDHWYGTQKEPSYQFDEAQCKVVAEYLKRHYVYDITLIDEEGHENRMNALGNRVVIITRNGLPKLISRGEDTEAGKKCPFKMKKLDLSKLKTN